MGPGISTKFFKRVLIVLVVLLVVLGVSILMQK